MPVRVVTDSTADLPAEVTRQWGITVVPLTVHFGQETYRNGVDITPDEFYRRLAAAPKLPTTAQPPVGAFVETYKALALGTEGILSIHISAKLSGTYNSALGAKEEVKGLCPIEVVDSLQGSLGLGLVALAAARAAQAGKPLGEVAAEARRASGQTLDTLEYLAKGGRIGKAQAFLGSLLNIKPIVGLEEGETHPFERVRSRRRALERLAQMARDLAPLQEAWVVHATTPDDARDLAERIKTLVPTGEVPIGRLGPVVGTYLGPGALGLALRRA